MLIFRAVIGCKWMPMRRGNLSHFQVVNEEINSKSDLPKFGGKTRKRMGERGWK